jgi:hypothetical protein
VQRCQEHLAAGRHARCRHGGVAEQRRQPPVKRPPSDTQVRVLSPPPNASHVMASVPGSYPGRQGSTPWRRTGPPPERRPSGTPPVWRWAHGPAGEWSPRRPVKAKTASSNLVGAANRACNCAGPGGPGHVVSPPAPKADGRRKPVWEFDSPALRHPVPGGHLGEIPKLDKGPLWKGGRRAPPVRGFESHSLRRLDDQRTIPGGIPKLDKGTVCYTVRAARRCVGSSPTPSAVPGAFRRSWKRSGWLRSPA